MAALTAAAGFAALLGLAGCGGEDAGAGACAPGTQVCAGDEVLRCRDDGQGYETVDSCSGGFYCWEGACVTGTPARDTLVGRDGGGPGPDADAGEDAGAGEDAVTPVDTAGPGDTAAPSDGGTPDGSPLPDARRDVAPDAARDDAARDVAAPPDAGPETVSPLCGNGVADPGEQCDPEAPAGTPAECPTACPAPAGCVRHALEGAAADCTARCRTWNVTEIGPGDGCCPDGAVHADDPDCPDTCGDGVVQPPERCDSGIAPGAVGACPDACPPGEGCAVWVLEGAATDCSAHCLLTTIEEPRPDDDCCPDGATADDDPDCAPACGNGRLEDGEECDGGLPPGTTCQSLGFASSELPVCASDCVIDTFPCGGHALVYEKITAVPPVSAARGSYQDVAFFPNGASALILTERDNLLAWDAATGSVSVFAEEPLDGVHRLAALPDRDAILVLGWAWVGDELAARAALVDGATGEIEPLPGLDTDGVAFVAVALSPDGGEAVLGAVNDVSRPTITSLYRVETEGWTILDQTAWASQHGLNDVVWARVPRSDPRFVVTLEGWSGVDSGSWYLDLGEGIQGNDWPVGFGNLGRGGWRPGGRYLLAAGTSTERIYVFSYSDPITWDWTSEGNIPGPSTNFVGVYWHPRGHRALVTGRASGLPRVGRVVEVVPRGPTFSSDDLRAADIPDFTEPPFEADGSAYLHAAAWQPGPCDGGLLVGDDDGTTWSPTFGLLIRFHDEDDPDCAP